MHLEILDSERQSLMGRLSFLRAQNFYLAGGTALALQIGHRTSIDFDFYTPQHFDPLLLGTRIQKEISSSEIRRVAEGTLICVVDAKIEMSFFTYEYPLLEACVNLPAMDLASLKDIAAMKAIAIAQRGLQRDFVDLYFLGQSMGLFEIIVSTLKKYPGYDVYTLFQSLCYFEDAENQEQRYRLLTPVTWEDVKNYFRREVRHVQKLF